MRSSTLSTTPGIDESPYIRFAIDQLTRDEEVRGSRHYADAPVSDVDAIEEEYPVDRIVSDEGLGYLQEQRQEQQYHQQQQEQRERDVVVQKEMAAGTPPRHPLNRELREQASVNSIGQFDVFVAYEPDVFTSQQPRLNFLPGVLRPMWMGLLVFLCTLMLAALLFCGLWSRFHGGLWNFVEFGDDRYFVFEYLPNILGMVIIMWLFQVQIAVQRISPFMAMASPTMKSRVQGAFLDLYPTQFLLPKLQHFQCGQPIIGFCFVVFWLALFTVPLLASAFNVQYFGSANGWRWVAVQGVVWAAAGLYALLIVALIVLTIRLRGAKTGLKWDPRSLIDVVAMMERANITNDYVNSEVFSSLGAFRQRLWNRSDRLGYWHTSRRPQDIFYGLGEEGGPTRRYSLEQGRIREKPPPGAVSGQSSVDSMRQHDMEPRTPTVAHDYTIRRDVRDEAVRHSYIPWYLTTTGILLWLLIVIILLVAFYVSSFVNQASIDGFLPQLSASVNKSGFSPANFVYSFVPSVVGLLLFLLWQPLDYAHRRLAPFAAMSSPNGAIAEKSLLLDYPFMLPISAVVSAAANGHWKVALLSALSFVNAVIPVLAGGIFWAQWYPGSSQVKIAADPAGLFAICAFLAIYTLAFFALLPGRKTIALPHDSRCLAEIMSWLYMSPLLIDRPFSRCVTKADLVARILPASTAETHNIGRKRSFWTSVTNLVSSGKPRSRAVSPEDDVEAGPSRDKRLSTVPEANVPPKALSRLGTTDRDVFRSNKLDRVGTFDHGRVRYGFGVYLGRDGREHLGIDRVRRGSREMVLFEDGNKRRSWIGF